MQKSVAMIVDHQDEISAMADHLVARGLTGFPQPAGDLHPAWSETASLPNFMCRLVAIQLAENRHALVAEAA